MSQDRLRDRLEDRLRDRLRDRPWFPCRFGAVGWFRACWCGFWAVWILREVYACR
jgi:hypothetical protein